jgi:hypothetical protein
MRGHTRRRRVPLEENHVAAEVLVRPAPEVIEPYVVERGGRSEARDVATDVRIAIRAHDHGHGIPAHVGADLLLHLVVAGRDRLLVGGDGIDVFGIGAVGHVDARLMAQGNQLFQQEMRPPGTFLGDDGLQCLKPFTGFPAAARLSRHGRRRSRRWPADAHRAFVTARRGRRAALAEAHRAEQSVAHAEPALVAQQAARAGVGKRRSSPCPSPDRQSRPPSACRPGRACRGSAAASSRPAARSSFSVSGPSVLNISRPPTSSTRCSSRKAGRGSSSQCSIRFDQARPRLPPASGSARTSAATQRGARRRSRSIQERAAGTSASIAGHSRSPGAGPCGSAPAGRGCRRRWRSRCRRRGRGRA